jgi:hypothetical protein
MLKKLLKEWVKIQDLLKPKQSLMLRTRNVRKRPSGSL